MHKQSVFLPLIFISSCIYAQDANPQTPQQTQSPFWYQPNYNDGWTNYNGDQAENNTSQVENKNNNEKGDEKKDDSEKKDDNGKNSDQKDCQDNNVKKDDNDKKDEKKSYWDDPIPECWQPRRALPPPFPSPPFPSAEYQGYPLVGVPPDDSVWPLMQSFYDTTWGDAIKRSRVKAYGWFNGSGNRSSCDNSNIPFSYWIVPNKIVLDQFVFRLERQVDSVQMDHIDWGFRSTYLYGIDYRFMTSGGWFSGQLLKHNKLYGYDLTEQYIDVYFPGVAQGMIVRVGRWIACPDIETQFAPDNYMGSHSILFTFDTYTQTGIMITIMLNEYWTVQAALHAGTDMAPWYEGAVPTGMFGVRWVSKSNMDSVYLVLNSINAAKFRHFTVLKQKAGHDNFNYLVGTWQHKFSDEIHTKTEGYFMWQRDTLVGGTVSVGPVRRFGGGGGAGAPIPGTTWAYGIVNYTMFETTPTSFITFRNEIWKDADGERSGFKGTYTSNAIGWSWDITQLLQIRPEIGYYRNWQTRAFDLGKRHGMMLYAADMTLRY